MKLIYIRYSALFLAASFTSFAPISVFAAAEGSIDLLDLTLAMDQTFEGFFDDGTYQAPRCSLDRCSVEDHLKILEAHNRKLDQALNAGCNYAARLLIEADQQAPWELQSALKAAYNGGNFDISRILLKALGIRCISCNSPDAERPVSADCGQWVCNTCVTQRREEARRRAAEEERQRQEEARRRAAQGQNSRRPNERFNPLPNEFRGKPIYYVHTNQYSGWSCGYHVLVAACTIEKKYGKGNPYSSWDKFIALTRPFVQANGTRPSDASNNKFLEDHASRLGLDTFMYWGIAGETPELHFNGECHIQWYGHITEAQKQQLLAAELNRQKQLIIDKTKKHWNNTRGVVCAHCCCHVISHGEDHVILLSVVKHADGKKCIYIYDNCNDPITIRSTAYRYIKHMQRFFNIR